jgi:stage III sporulation protein AG
MIKKLKKEHLLIGALVGILLLVIAIPVPKIEKDEAPETDESVLESVLEQTTEEQLKSILQKISGVGRVEVLITYEDHGRVVVEKDTSLSEELVQEADANGGTRTTTTSRNDMTTVYEDEGLTIDVCYGWAYFEVFGLSDAEFLELEEYYESLRKERYKK